jgi:hypothetical protein
MAMSVRQTVGIAAVVFLLLPVAGPAQDMKEDVLWATIEKSTNPDDFRGYLDAYPNGIYAPLARRRLATLTESRLGVEKQKEAARLIVRAHHWAMWHDCKGYLRITPEAAIYEGRDRFNLLKDGVSRITGAQGAIFFTFEERGKDRTLQFILLDDKKAAEGGWRIAPQPHEILDILAAKWGFVRAKEGDALLPPGPNSAPTTKDTGRW